MKILEEDQLMYITQNTGVIRCCSITVAPRCLHTAARRSQSNQGHNLSPILRK